MSCEYSPRTTTISEILNTAPVYSGASLPIGHLRLPDWELLRYYSDGEIMRLHPQDTEVTFLMLVAEAENLWG